MRTSKSLSPVLATAILLAALCGAASVYAFTPVVDCFARSIFGPEACVRCIERCEQKKGKFQVDACVKECLGSSLCR